MSFGVRELLHAQLEAAARRKGKSPNAEITRRLVKSIGLEVGGFEHPEMIAIRAARLTARSLDMAKEAFALEQAMREALRGEEWYHSPP